jgi:hypothetical protein
MSLIYPAGRKVVFLLLILIMLPLNGCSFQVRKTAPDSDRVMVFIPPAVKPTEQIVTATPEGANKPTKIVCEDKLTFIEDVNYPDGSVVSPQATIEKQWRVKNTGACDWNQGYSVTFKEGDALGAEESQPLPAVPSDSEFVIKITLRAPAQPGYYRGVWQASNPDGMLFGDPVYVDIIVTN